ncbi:MAG: hypothetical protein JWP81_3588 [Ferruginibacter sp.]|nr:hypothetical protein [Ferruginibacter sp.]
MKRLFHFILSHSIFIAFCASALSLQTLQLLSLPVNGYLLAFIFFATLCGYNIYWTVSRFSFGNNISLIPFLEKSRSALLVILAAITGMVFCFSRLHLVMYNVVITFILLGMYALPLMPFKQLHFLRKAGFLKTVVLALAWTIVTILIPLQISIREMGHAALLIFINRFLFMLMLCIIFDKRDAAIDKIRGLQSLATDIRPMLLHFFMLVIFIAYASVSFAMRSYNITNNQVTALVVSGFVALYVYYRSMQKRGYIFYYFVVDGLMFFSALLTGLASLN